MNKKRALFQWSGGKDSAMALQRIMQNPEYSVERLLTTINESQNRVTMHGVRRDMIQKQAEQIGLPLSILSLPDSPEMDSYNRAMYNRMSELGKEGFTHAIFGDIYLEDLRDYRVNQMQKSGFRAVFPIWNEKPAELIQQFISEGFRAVAVCTSAEKLDKSFCGREIDEAFIEDLPDEVDVCGENGEFHTFVYDGPIFKNPVPFKKGEIHYREYDSPGQPGETSGFWFCDLLTD